MALNLNCSFTGTPVISGNGWSLAQPEKNVSLGLCYIKVQTITGSKEKINFIISNTSPNGPIKYENFSFVPNLTDTNNFIAQAYDYLKTLPEFANSVDC